MNLLVLYVFALLHTAAPPPIPADSVSYPQNYFISPIDIPIALAGNFGEPRTSHFHTGLDIKTDQEEGHKVFAAAEGYISRINVSGAGYGNALYVTHPNGYVTAYAHLQQFVPELTQRLRKEQYAKKSFAVDFQLKPGEYPVKKGQLIALSGNSGGSGGPHLHFEIRDTAEWPINPLLFGYKLQDNIKPTISTLKFYAEDELKYKSDGYRVPVVLTNGVYAPANALVKLNATKVGIAVNTYDGINLTASHIGVYSIKMYDGKKLVYEYRIDKLSFADKRYVISHVDYPVFVLEGHRAFHKCYVEPGNKCPVYRHVADRGTVDISDGNLHEIKIEVSDFSGNVSVSKFNLQHNKASTAFKTKELKYNAVFPYNKDNEFANADVKVKVPAGCLFEDLFFAYDATLSIDPKIYSKVHQLSNANVRTFDWFNISLKTLHLPANLAEKALILHKNLHGGNEACGGKLENGIVTTRVREFGTYFIAVDTTKPKITPLNIKPNRNMRAYKRIQVRIGDNLSGIGKFDTYMDGEWVLTEYDSKSSILTHHLNQQLSSGVHTFKVVVTDERRNMSEYSVKFKM